MAILLDRLHKELLYPYSPRRFSTEIIHKGQGMALHKPSALVGIVDDDQSIRESISSLVRSAGYRSAVFASGTEFLASNLLGEIACLVLDIKMSGLGGIEVHRKMSELRLCIPVVFITARADDSVRARALQNGAVALLDKPFREEALLGAIESAVRSSAA